jgi:hypothetical protein
MSALTPKADITDNGRHGGYGPMTDISVSFDDRGEGEQLLRHRTITIIS